MLTKVHAAKESIIADDPVVIGTAIAPDLPLVVGVKVLLVPLAEGMADVSEGNAAADGGGGAAGDAVAPGVTDGNTIVGSALPRPQREVSAMTWGDNVDPDLECRKCKASDPQHRHLRRQRSFNFHHNPKTRLWQLRLAAARRRPALASPQATQVALATLTAQAKLSTP